MFAVMKKFTKSTDGTWMMTYNRAVPVRALSGAWMEAVCSLDRDGPVMGQF